MLISSYPKSYCKNTKDHPPPKKTLQNKQKNKNNCFTINKIVSMSMIFPGQQCNHKDLPQTGFEVCFKGFNICKIIIVAM